MRSETVTTILSAPQQQVFEYRSDIERLPEWATEFARELRREGEDYKVVNGLGEFYFEIKADPETGVIDMFAAPIKEQMRSPPPAPSPWPTAAPRSASPCSKRPTCPTSCSNPSTTHSNASSPTSKPRSRTDADPSWRSQKMRAGRIGGPRMIDRL